MEKEIIKELLERYNLTAYDNIVDTYIKLIQLGFNQTWLRNMCIIREFDELYKTDKKVMDIYMDLGITYQDLSINHIRKIIKERALYEI